MVSKSTTGWQTKSPASGHPSTLMDKPTTAWQRRDCALLMTNSTTSAGWLRKTNFRELTGNDSDPVQARVRIEMARHHAILLLKAGIKEYSQWFPG
jgi:hypothetical protein